MVMPERLGLPNKHASFWNEVAIAIQSGLSAGLCLGFPVGIVYWLILINNSTSSFVVAELMNFFVNNVQPGWLIILFGTVTWGIILSRIVGYHRWYLLSLAITVGIFVGQLPMQNGRLDIAIQRFGFPVHIRFGLVLGITVFCAMVCTGLALGLVSRNWKVSLTLAGSSAFTSVLGAMLVFLLMDHVGIRVGNGNYAMLKNAAVEIMTAAIIGGATLGVVLGRYVSEKSR